MNGIRFISTKVNTDSKSSLIVKLDHAVLFLGGFGRLCVKPNLIE